MEFGRNKKTAVKWTAYILLLLLFCGFQSTPGLFAVWGVRPALVLPMAVAVALFEREAPAGAFGLLAGFLWDLSAERLFGFYGMVVMLCCVTVTLLSMYCIRVNMTNFILGCLAVNLICGTWNFLFYDLLWGYEGVWLFGWKMLLQTVYTTAAGVPVYLLVRWITGKLSPVVRA